MVLKSKKVGETLGYPVDFSSSLGPTETITVAGVTASVYTGVDPNPGALIFGVATVSGNIVNQGITGGVIGTVYELLYTVQTSLHQVIEISAFLAVEPDLP